MQPKYDADRLAELREKHKEPEPDFRDWQDFAEDDAGVARFGEI